VTKRFDNKDMRILAGVSPSFRGFMLSHFPCATLVASRLPCATASNLNFGIPLLQMAFA
jgi:hypothetical protein